MGKVMNRVKGATIIGVSAVGGLLGIELGGFAGDALYNDVLFCIGKAPHPVYREGKLIKRYTRVNPYNGKKTRVVYNKKTQKFVAVKHQPKGYVMD